MRFSCKVADWEEGISAVANGRSRFYIFCSVFRQYSAKNVNVFPVNFLLDAPYVNVYSYECGTESMNRPRCVR